jgi:V/A-type H+-transporting ATPase subunit D
MQGLEVYPAAVIEAGRFDSTTSNFMGVMLADTGLGLPEGDSGAAPANPSPEVRACQAAFRELLQRAAGLAGVSGNLHRLLSEYRLTERRARALENVILPEIEQNLKVMTTHLEELEFEDTVRVRRQAGI